MTFNLSALLQRPEGRAALISGVLVVLLPLALVLIVSMGVDSSNVVRARVSARLEYALASLFGAVAYLMAFIPLALVTGGVHGFTLRAIVRAEGQDGKVWWRRVGSV